MPQHFGQNIAVTIPELIPAHWNNYSALAQELYRYADKPYGVKRLQKGGNGRQLLVDFDSLPPAVQSELGDPRKPKHLLDEYYATDQEAVTFYHDFTYPDGSYLKPASIEQYVINASMFKAILKLKEAREAERQTKGASLRGVTATLCYDANGYQERLNEMLGQGHKLPTNERRFKQALTKFEQDGYASLIKDAKGKAKKNALKATEQVVELLNNLFASQPHKPTATEVADQYNAFLNGTLEVFNPDTGEVYAIDGYAAISASTVKRYLTQWANKIATHGKRSGDRQVYQQQFKPYHSLKQPEFAGSIISIDDRQPPFEYEKGSRMWFYNAIDLGSEAFVCWVHGKTKEGIILDFYRQLVRNFHAWGLPLPAELECESSLNASFKDTFLREGQMFKHVRIEANNARGKRIEAYYRPLRYGLEKKREGWLARPFSKSEANQAGPKGKQIIPIEQLAEQCLQDICTWNNMEHSKIKGKTRWEVFIERQNPNLQPTNYKAILPYLGYSTFTSCNAGIIKLQNREWLLGIDGKIATGDTLVRLMAEVEGKEFKIYWLDDNAGVPFKALVYLNDRYVCEAVAKPVYSRASVEFNEADKAARGLMSAYVASVEAYRKEKAGSLTEVAVIDNRSLTLNNGFTMPELQRPATATQREDVADAEELEQLPEEQELPDTSQSFFKDLNDTY